MEDAARRRGRNGPMPMASLQQRHARKFFAAFFALSPLHFRNRATHASVQNFSYEESDRQHHQRQPKKRSELGFPQTTRLSKDRVSLASDKMTEEGHI